MRWTRKIRFTGFLLIAALISACGIPTPDPNSAQGKRAILFDVETYLSQGACSPALTEILPLYNSSNTDNDVRMAMASVYACEGGFNFFNFLNGAQNANFSSPGVFFELFATEFPSKNNLSDKIVESAGFGIDALQSVISPGQVLIPGDLFNTTTPNESSLLYSDRTHDSNEYLFYMAMVAMGGLENRVGATAAGKPTNNPPLPWITSATAGMATTAGATTSGCEFASALVNLADAAASISTQCCTGSNCPVPSVTNIPAYVTNQLNCLINAALPGKSLAQVIYDSCNYGCTNTVPPVGAYNATGSWSAAACGSNTGACAMCPMLLRNRNNCAGTANDQVSCAAAGVINFVNNSGIAWQ